MPAEYMSPATEGSTWPAALVSTPIMARPDMEWLRLMPPSTLVGGVFQPVSSLYRPGTVECVEYIMPLSSDPGDIPDMSTGTVCCMLELPSDLGFPARLEGE